MDAARLRHLALALVACASSACEELDYHGASSGFWPWRIEHAGTCVYGRALEERVKFDGTLEVASAFGLDEYGEPLTKYRSISTDLAPSPSWKKKMTLLCLERDGASSAFVGGRFGVFSCYGPPIYTEEGYAMEGELLFQVSFVP